MDNSNIMCKLRVFCVILAGFCAIGATHMVRIVNLEVPEDPLKFDDAPLNCQYQIGENDTLYDVKWYKDEIQFFRCLGNGTVHEFHIEGIKLHHSGMTTFGNCPVTLLQVTEEATGRYKCEVSLDFPSYKNEMQSAMMRIIPYPRSTGDTTSFRADSTPTDTPIVTPSSIQYSPYPDSGSSSRHSFISIIIVFINASLIYLYL